MEIKEAIAILARIQEPEAWEPQITREAWQALEMAKEALVKESQGLAKDSVKDLPDLRQQAIDLLDEQIAICDRALTNPGISMNDEFAVKVEKRSLIAYREKLECLLSTEPEIIRCKECKYWTNNIGDSKLRDNYCNEAVHGFYYRCSGDDYCSFAERRTENADVNT